MPQISFFLGIIIKMYYEEHNPNGLAHTKNTIKLML